MAITSSNPLFNEIPLQAFKLASPIVLALKECDPALRESAVELFEQLHSGELDPEQVVATCALIAEILFPNADAEGRQGLDLQEAEAVAPSVNTEAGPVLTRFDAEETTFSQRLRHYMDVQQMTQAELATKVGIGQPAISMMLNRTCRPQRKTVQRIAAALGVDPTDLWPATAPGP